MRLRLACQPCNCYWLPVNGLFPRRPPPGGGSRISGWGSMRKPRFSFGVIYACSFRHSPRSCHLPPGGRHRIACFSFRRGGVYSSRSFLLYLSREHQGAPLPLRRTVHRLSSFEPRHYGGVFFFKKQASRTACLFFILIFFPLLENIFQKPLYKSKKCGIIVS